MHGRSIIAMGLSLFLSATLWGAAGPDEEYVRIYRMVVEADSLREAGQSEAALKVYQSSKESLAQLQMKFPAWNERLLIYRLNYVSAQIKSLTNPVAPSPALPTPSSAPPQSQTPALDPQVLRLREENQTLRVTAARLEAKLKEALSVQPNTTDPKELDKAQEQLRELLVENQTLKNHLQEGEKKITSLLATNSLVRSFTNQPAVTNFAYVTNRVIVEPPDLLETRRNLTNQLGAVSALRVENEVLKKELQAAKSVPPAPAPVNPNPELERQLQEALRSLKSMQDANQELAKKHQSAERLLAETKISQSSQEEKLKGVDQLERQLAETRAETQRLAAQKEALEKRLSLTLTDNSLEGEGTRRLVKLEKELLESQSQVRLLSRQKGELEQKLSAVKSTASGTPGASTPLQLTPGAGGEAASVEVHRQLKQAAWDVLNLQAQNQEMLKKQSVLEQQLARSGGSKAGLDALDEDRLRRLEQLNLELSETKKTTMRLERENQELARHMAEGRQAQPQPAGRSPKDDAFRQQLQEAQSKLRQAEEANRELSKKSQQLEKQLAQAKSTPAPPATSPVAPAASVRTDRVEKDLAEAREQARRLEQENRNLEKKLALAEQVPSSRRSASSSKTANPSRNLERELAMLKSRLDVLEAKAVPYTEQELALFGRLEANIGSPAGFSSNRAATTDDSAKGSPSENAVSAPATALMKEARADYEAGRFSEAERKFQRLLEPEPSSVYALTHLAAAQFALQKLDEADKTVRRALTLSPEDAPSLYLLGLIRLSQDKLDDAVDALSRSARINPQNALTQNSLGVALSQKGLREPAETAFRKALQLQPDQPDAHYNLAVEYILQQPPSFKLAQWHYQKATTHGHARNSELEKRLEAAAKAAVPTVK